MHCKTISYTKNNDLSNNYNNVRSPWYNESNRIKFIFLKKWNNKNKNICVSIPTDRFSLKFRNLVFQVIFSPNLKEFFSFLFFFFFFGKQRLFWPMKGWKWDTYIWYDIEWRNEFCFVYFLDFHDWNLIQVQTKLFWAIFIRLNLLIFTFFYLYSESPAVEVTR